MSYHLIGIGGIGMSGLARILRARGETVQGSDIAQGELIEQLKESGIKVFSCHDSDHVNGAKTVIYSTDIKQAHPEYIAAEKENLSLCHRSHLLGSLMEGYESLLVTGTHGKTTTSALLAHVLMHAKYDPSFAVGGIPLNYGVNGHHGKGSLFIAEADESDGSFLNYSGSCAIITNLEEDHLSFWKTFKALKEGFEKFAAQISKHLWWCADDPALSALQLKGKSYGFSLGADLRITASCQRGWSLFFDLEMEEKVYREVEIPLIGVHNVLNAASVFGLALDVGVKEEEIRSAFKTFKGVKRRMEKRGEKRGVIVLDDYAHHPTEIQTTLEALRKASGEKRIVAIFQPHRFSRFRDCWDQFLKAFDAADVVFVTDVYGSGEAPIEGITGEKFAEQRPARFVKRDALGDALQEFLRPHDVVITLGAGDITRLKILDLDLKPFRMTLLQGGKSREHEVSLSSARTVIASLNPDFYEVDIQTISKEGKWGKEMPSIVSDLLLQDFVFPVLHGPLGEDGMIQGFLETLGVPYVGCDFRSSALVMDKAWTKHVAQGSGVPVARFFSFSIEEWTQDRDIVNKKIESSFTCPFYIKAVHLGSTFGVYRITGKGQIQEAIEKIALLDYAFLVEEEVVGREIEFGFLGKRVSDGAEVIRASEIHTYENKYSSKALPSVPKVALDGDVLQKGKEMAEAVYKAARCSALSRIDFFLKEDGTWVFNEINPMPGLTPTSVYPVIWKAEGMEMREVIDQVVISSLHRAREQQKRLRA